VPAVVVDGVEHKGDDREQALAAEADHAPRGHQQILFPCSDQVTSAHRKNSLVAEPPRDLRAHKQMLQIILAGAAFQNAPGDVVLKSARRKKPREKQAHQRGPNSPR
jgi:hypothetical protein